MLTTVLVSNSQHALEEVGGKFFNRLEIRTSNKIEKFIGLTVEGKGADTKLHNGPMIKRLLKHFSMKNSEPAVSPLAAGLDLSKHPGDLLRGQTQYRQLIGGPVHLLNTVRRDICHAVQYLSALFINQRLRCEIQPRTFALLTGNLISRSFGSSQEEMYVYVHYPIQIGVKKDISKTY